jgi:hypothetical protein
MMGLCLFLSSFGRAQLPKNTDGTLRVIDVRQMTDDEYHRRGLDVIGMGFIARLRYEAPSDQGIYIYSPNEGRPYCYSLERVGAKITWLLGIGTDVSHSPGFESTQERHGKGWIYMPARSAFEWEVMAWPTKVGAEDAKSVFVKRTTDGAATEIVSNWYSTTQSK